MTAFDTIAEAIEREQPIVVATILSGDRIGAKFIVSADGTWQGHTLDDRLAELLETELRPLLESEIAETRAIELPSGETIDVFVESHLPPRRLVVVGAVHTAIPLVNCARELGYHTTVIDARELFATRERFPHADELITEWPDEALARLPLGPQTDIVLLAHDPKFEDPALHVVLKSRAGYIGAMGSKKTSAERNERLLTEGFTREQVDRIHGPIGIDIGGRAPGEIAISILAEIIAVRSGRDPRRSGTGLLPAKAELS